MWQKNSSKNQRAAQQSYQVQPQKYFTESYFCMCVCVLFFLFFFLKKNGFVFAIISVRTFKFIQLMHICIREMIHWDVEIWVQGMKFWVFVLLSPILISEPLTCIWAMGYELDLLPVTSQPHSPFLFFTECAWKEFSSVDVHHFEIQFATDTIFKALKHILLIVLEILHKVIL